MTSFLHDALQARNSDIVSAKSFASTTISHLQNLKTKERFEQIYKELVGVAKENKLINEANNDVISVSPRQTRNSNKKRKLETEPVQQQSFYDLNYNKYFVLFNNTVDLFISEIMDKFKDEDYKPLLFAYQLITNENFVVLNLKEELNLYKDIIDLDKLEIEFHMWHDFKKINNLNDLTKIKFFFVQKEQRSIFPNIFSLLQLYLTVPISSAEAERAFSCLKRVKSSLRSTMSQERLSSLAIINFEGTKNVDVNEAITSFIGKKRRLKFN